MAHSDTEIGFSIHGLRSPEEVSVTWAAIREYRRSAKQAASPAPESESGNETGDPQPASATGERVERICAGLKKRPRLDQRYTRILQVLFEAPPDQWVAIADLAAKVGASGTEIRANLSKISARM